MQQQYRQARASSKKITSMQWQFPNMVVEPLKLTFNACCKEAARYATHARLLQA
jgi:hypothetical protein